MHLGKLGVFQNIITYSYIPSRVGRSQGYAKSYRLQLFDCFTSLKPGF